MPPVPMTFRQAAKTDYIEGVLVPKGTIFYIPVCGRGVRLGSLVVYLWASQIRVINTWKEVWGEDAEEYAPQHFWNKMHYY